jgi:hypothetical protein
MVLDALGSIATRLESQKIVGIENLLVCRLYLRDWLEPVSTRPNFFDPWNEGSKLCPYVDNMVNNGMRKIELPFRGTSGQ